MSAAAPAIAIADYRPRPELLKTRPYELQRYAQFRTRHNRAPFVPHMIAALQAMILDEQAQDAERVFAWVLLMSHGNFNDLATDANDLPLAAADCSRALGLPRQRVSEAIARLEGAFRLRRDGRSLYPVDDPIAKREKAKVDDMRRVCPDRSDKRRMKGEQFELFRLNWESSHPTEAQRRAELRETIERARRELAEINQKEIVAYDQVVLSQTGRTKSYRQVGRKVTHRSDERRKHPY